MRKANSRSSRVPSISFPQSAYDQFSNQSGVRSIASEEGNVRNQQDFPSNPSDSSHELLTGVPMVNTSMTIKLGNLPVSLSISSHAESVSILPPIHIMSVEGTIPSQVSSAVSCFSENSSQTVQDSLSSPLCRSSDSPPLQLIQPLVIYTSSKPVSSPEPVVDPPTPSVCCRCTRTHCLKLYCDCLRAGKVCTAECKCSECCNRPRCHERVKTLKKMKKTNPQAFKKCKVKGYESSVSCACQKSMCNKKYCSCYQSGKLCSSKCKCVDCNNRSNDAFV